MMKAVRNWFPCTSAPMNNHSNATRKGAQQNACEEFWLQGREIEGTVCGDVLQHECPNFVQLSAKARDNTRRAGSTPGQVAQQIEFSSAADALFVIQAGDHHNFVDFASETDDDLREAFC